QSDTGTGVALHRLGDNLPGRNVGQLLADAQAQDLVGEDPNALGRNQRSEAIDRLLQQRPITHDGQELLGAFRSAPRPETRSTPSSQDHRVEVWSLHSLSSG